MAQVIIHDQSDFERCLSIFTKRCQREGIVNEVKRRVAHVPKSELKRQEARLRNKANKAQTEQRNRQGGGWISSE